VGRKAVDAMSSELERLRADLATIKAAQEIYKRDYPGCDAQAMIGIIEKRIARLEAEQADPWREAKEAIERYRGLDSKHWGLSKTVAEYVDYLTADRDRLAARVADLERQNHNYKAQVGRLQASALAKHVQDVYVECDKLAARVAELENESEPAKVDLRRAEEVKVGDVILAGGYTQTVTNIEPETTQRIIKCDGWMAWFRNKELVAVVNGDDIPDDPIQLNPDRTIATAAKILARDNPELAGALMQAYGKGAKPYEVCDE
jgi:hypothetical protein